MEQSIEEVDRGHQQEVRKLMKGLGGKEKKCWLMGRWNYRKGKRQKRPVGGPLSNW